MRVRGVGAVLVALTAALSACSGTSGAPAVQPGQASPDRTVTIGVVAPISGDLGHAGTATQNGVLLAVKRAKALGLLPGWTLKLDVEDDEAKPDTGARMANTLAGNDTVIGVVGPLSSTVALTTSPVLAQHGLVEISPSNSDVRLTARDQSDGRVRPYPTYFRLVATDDAQWSLAARYAVRALRKKRIAIVHDSEAYARGLAAGFRAAVEREGAAVAGSRMLPADEPNAAQAAAAIRVGNPDAVFFAGDTTHGVQLVRAMTAEGLDVPLLGTDGIRTHGFLAGGGRATEGDYAVDVGEPVVGLPSARGFVADYRALRANDDNGPDVAELSTAAYAYDAANLLIAAARTALQGRSQIDSVARQAAVRAVQQTRTTGATGPVSFDAFGDTTNRVATVYQVRGGEFVPITTERVG